MGLLFSVPVVTVREGPEGPPYNAYWLERLQESSWKLRDALLDGDVSKTTELLGLPNDIDDQIGAPNETTSDQMTPSTKSRSCMSIIWRCFRQENHCNTTPSLPQTKQIEPPPLATFEIDSYKWFDDGDNTAVHYLALGRTESTYSGVNLHVSVLHGGRSQSASISTMDRCLILTLLIKYRRITADTFFVRNAAGSLALHFAAAHGELQIIQAILNYCGDVSDDIRLWPDPSGLLPSDLALSRGHVPCARELGLLVLSNLDNVRARCDAILSLHEADRPIGDGDWASALEIHEMPISIQSTDSQRISVIRHRELELASALSIPLV
jgi:hypothetical protein